MTHILHRCWLSVPIASDARGLSMYVTAIVFAVIAITHADYLRKASQKI